MPQASAFTTRAATEEMGQLLDTPPAVTGESLRGDTLLTQRWKHGALHGYLRGLNSNIIVTYYGSPRDMRLEHGGKRHIGRTTPGTITLIPDGQDGKWDIDGEIEVSHVYLPEQRLRDCSEQLMGGKPFELLARVGFDDPSAARILEILSREAATPDPASSLFAEQAIDLLCTQLIRSHSSVSSLPDIAPRQGLAHWQVKKVCDYMRGRLAEPISLDELAAVVHLSRFHFCTAFRRSTGQTPHTWLVQERIALARTLLADNLLSVTEVGLAVGYGTPSAFTASFRKIVGTTPTDYRRCL